VGGGETFLFQFYIGSFDTEEEAREGIAKFNEEEILQSG
jgi:hypothetical protein